MSAHAFRCQRCGHLNGAGDLALEVERKFSELRAWCEETGRVTYPPEPRVREEVAAEILGVSRSTLQNWRTMHHGPRSYKAARITYALRDLAEHLVRSSRRE